MVIIILCWKCINPCFQHTPAFKAVPNKELPFFFETLCTAPMPSYPSSQFPEWKPITVPTQTEQVTFPSIKLGVYPFCPDFFLAKKSASQDNHGELNSMKSDMEANNLGGV